MSKLNEPDGRASHGEMLRSAWDHYQEAYMNFNLKEVPDFHRRYSEGAVTLDAAVVQLAGDVFGAHLLDTCCAGDAKQAFSWENLGARVTACDISPVAIRIAKGNAYKIGSNATFVEADAQTLSPVPDSSVDIVVATYICWFEDLFLCCRNWHRVLKPRGRLVLTHGNPVMQCLSERDGVLAVERDYFDTSPDYYRFDGTPLADKHGGWKGEREIVEFFHPLAEVINAIADAGFVIRRLEELATWDNLDRDETVPRLPVGMAILAEV